MNDGRTFGRFFQVAVNQAVREKGNGFSSIVFNILFNREHIIVINGDFTDKTEPLSVVPFQDQRRLRRKFAAFGSPDRIVIGKFEAFIRRQPAEFGVVGRLGLRWGQEFYFRALRV